MSHTYVSKYRKVAKLLEPYKKFGDLGLSFDSVYESCENIKQMLENPYIAAQWQ